MLLSSRALLLASMLLGLAALPACAKAADSTVPVQAEDLRVDPDSPPFNPNEILDFASMVDWTGVKADQVQAFFHRTPYQRLSFLETYQSNGQRAVDAVMRSAQRYRINPLVFIVRMEMEQGLLGEQFYPFPPSRVEYVFRCGCVGPSTCDPALAGLDRQLDCFGRTLRTALDEVKANGTTSGGWAPAKPQTTLDGVTVTPADVSTAVFYQYTPLVAVGKNTGNWMFWNLWQKYATALSYVAPTEPITGPVTWIGDACPSASLCDYAGGICLQGNGTPGGMCSFDCRTAACPSDPDKPATFCANIQVDDAGPPQGYCMPVCNPAAPACRTGYSCVGNVQQYGGSATGAVCFN